MLKPIKERMEMLDGKRMMPLRTSLMSNEERRFMWNLVMVLHEWHGGNGLAVYEIVRSFITFNGIFMGPGYELGDQSLSLLYEWRR